MTESDHAAPPGLEGEAFLPAAQAAKDAFCLSDGSLAFIGHSDTCTYRVTRPGHPGSYLLRLHTPLLQIRQSIWYKRDVIESELLWLSALREEGNLLVQRPLRMSDGTGTVVVYLDRTNAKPVVCSLLEWIEGERPSSSNAELAALEGRLMAQLHAHASSWCLPSGFLRPSYDDARALKALASLAPEHTSVVSAEAYAVLGAVVDRICRIMSELGQDAKSWSLIHADVHPSNVILDRNGNLVPIDFGSCGFGYYLFDLAWTLSYFAPDLRPDFLNAYQEVRELPPAFFTHVGAFHLAALIDSLSFWSNNPGDQAWAAEFLPGFLQDQCRPFLAEQPFYKLDGR